ncbi:AAA family ATPase [Vibrio sp. ZSDZ65]|uniref:AAA family ATPase n=1 Tax=Vibrio qingdaonensis TaxID=2829491 RepID=A0A9X3CQR2_9VIBR|nr:AAA family ATPase [Vibrio qingdaonensis]MCW8347686.1 AAA family ATPase [Vibrio qingdaonensis]
MKLTDVEINGKQYRLTNSNSKCDSNVYTLFLGENGSGKSETIRELINILLRMKVSDKHNYKHNDILDSYLENRYKATLEPQSVAVAATINYKGSSIHSSFVQTNEDRVLVNFKGEKQHLKEDAYRYEFSVRSQRNDAFLKRSINDINIVAVSESPYIKFPIIQSDEVVSYFYIGKIQEKDYKYMNSISDDYVNPKVEQLAKSILLTLEGSNKTNVSAILDYLSFGKRTSIKFRLKSDYYHRLDSTPEFADRIISSQARDRFTSLGLGDTSTNSNNRQKEKLIAAIDYVKSKITIDSNDPFDNRFNSELMEINFDITEYNSEAENIATLLYFNLINISNVFFEYDGNYIDSLHLSSGQVCILSNIFGIASRITDNTFIFIDEPEISLHPSWQAGFIRLLEETFIKYIGCHFIIATHSPHIVSNINKDNAHVVPMHVENSSHLNLTKSYQGWTVDEILQDVMGMDETRSRLYKSLIVSFNEAIERDDSYTAHLIHKELSEILHPENVLRRVLEIQMIGVGDD